ncbi:copper-binding protein [Magnetovibrio sp. PR-2]|uniref:copper-binding protein n=1 Tax=Magnetovibrio sp. PR-2 TaxID=3120356 RepID=UPI002FCE1B27
MKKTLSIAMATLTIGFMSTAALAGSGHGDTKNMKGHEMGMAGINATGKVNTVQDGKVNISHGKIKELGWPPMKMDFAIAEGVDVSKVKPGQEVEFVLGNGKGGMYEIMDIKMAH